MNRLNFFKIFLKDKNVASVTPSSKFTIEKVCRKIDFNKKIVIVEYGAGTGVFSKFILKKINPKSKLILIETNKQFIPILKKIKDPRILIFNDSAENVKEILNQCNEKNADYVISGIPFSYFDKKLANKIIKNTKEVLSAKGKFLVYQFSKSVNDYLEKHFKNITFDIEVANIPPLLIFEAFN